MSEVQFHVVKRDTENEADILKFVCAEDMPWAVYRRVEDRPDLHHGSLIAAFWDEDIAIITCKSMNACGNLIRTMLED